MNTRIPDTIWLTEILKDIGTDESHLEAQVTKILLAYNDSSRYYHTMNHIRDVYYSFHEILNELLIMDSSRTKCAIAAIIFHDFVYQTNSDMKVSLEEESTAAVVEFAVETGIAFTPEEISYTVDLILATTNHQPKDEFPETLAFLDADMAILSYSRPQYMQYASEIRKEWPHVSDSIFSQGRSNFLKHTLEKTCFFYTEPMRKKEETARENMRYELKLLDSFN